MMRNVSVLLAVLVMCAGSARGQESNGLRAVDYLGESGGALLGGVAVGSGAALVLGLVGYAVFPDEYGIAATFGAMAGAAVGYPAGCGLGTTVAGGALGVSGNVEGAYGGALLGMGLGALGFFAPQQWVGLVTMAVLAPAGAVAGYSIGVARDGQGSYFGRRVLPPAITYSRRSTPDRQAYAVVDCRLVTVRF